MSEAGGVKKKHITARQRRQKTKSEFVKDPSPTGLRASLWKSPPPLKILKKKSSAGTADVSFDV